ncbi:MAG: ClpXP protease specificity-enhancing factor SspB [Pseudomonadota bacterium]
MGETGLNYGDMMQRALRGVMADALDQVQAHGLPGEHHFYITYDTTHPSVAMPDWLFERYPDQITIVIQHEYDDLEVSPDGFAVSMSFSSRNANLYVPFDAVLTFVDPSVEFGLKFDATEIDIEDEDEDDVVIDPPVEDAKGTADVVSLDQFRKN